MSIIDSLASYTLRRHPWSRGIRITVHPDSRIVVTAPYLVSQKTIANFVEAHQDWIKNKLEHFAKLGPVTRLGGGKNGYQKYKEQARILVKQKINKINEHYNFAFQRVAIKNSRSRWGSCSQKGNLNFNYKIMFLPDHLADYVVAHELCHLREMNHSKRFWDLVAQTTPDWRACRRELRRNIM